MSNGVFRISLLTDVAASFENQKQGKSRASMLREFIGGPENYFVKSAEEDFLNPKSPYNPLLFYGASGTGKSFLARGFGNLWLEFYPNSNVIFTTAADFAREYAAAMENDRLKELRRRFRSADLLVVDNLDELSGKRPAQVELVQTVDTLWQHQAKVIVTSNESPDKMNKVIKKLSSRLLSGLSIPLLMPGKAARLEILKSLSRLRKIDLSDTAARTLADNLSLSVPQLQRVLIELTRNKNLISNSDARDYINRYKTNSRPSLQIITKHVARHFSEKVSHLKGPTRRQSVVRARGVAMYLARNLTGKSYQHIGLHFGNRDHSTVMHACRTTEKLRLCDPVILRAIEILNSELIECGNYKNMEYQTAN